jgi:hypothetical protein
MLAAIVISPIAQTRIIWSLCGMLRFKDGLHCQQFAAHLKWAQAILPRLGTIGFCSDH